MTGTDDRRYDLDWLRIIAFGLLILYHVGMFYVTWDWHAKSSRASHAIEPLMLLTNPWRLILIFLISGAATRFMADKMNAWQFVGSRMRRLWPPLLLAIFVIVPPQSYFEVAEALQEVRGTPVQPQSLWLQDFYFKYMTGSGNWCDAEGCLVTPTYNHMWFVAYLIIYTLALIPLLPLLRRVPRSVSTLLRGPGMILTPWIVMFGLRATLFPLFGETHDIRTDWYLHTLYFATFLFGFGIAKYQAFFERCARLRRMALAIALVAWAMLTVYYIEYAGSSGRPPVWLLMLAGGIHELQAWTGIIAAVGYAHQHLRGADGPLRRLLTEAIFPFYLIHQTIIVVTAHYLDALLLPLAIEVPLLIGVTALGCWLFYDLGRRLPALRVWLGLSRSHASRVPSMEK